MSDWTLEKEKRPVNHVIVKSGGQVKAYVAYACKMLQVDRDTLQDI